MKIGFTGTRYGCSNEQLYSLREFVKELEINEGEAHHGDCIGADTEFHNAIRTICRPSVKIVIHPPVVATLSDRQNWARNKGDFIEQPCTHLARNRIIVQSVDFMIACPLDLIRTNMGGTWYTVNYARKQGKDVVIVWPDGKIELDN